MNDASDLESRPLIIALPPGSWWKARRPYKTFTWFEEVVFGEVFPTQRSMAQLGISAWHSGRLNLGEPWLRKSGDLTHLISL